MEMTGYRMFWSERNIKGASEKVAKFNWLQKVLSKRLEPCDRKSNRKSEGPSLRFPLGKLRKILRWRAPVAGLQDGCYYQNESWKV
jgi:hypothetical protein